MSVTATALGKVNTLFLQLQVNILLFTLTITVDAAYASAQVCTSSTRVNCPFGIFDYIYPL